MIEKTQTSSVVRVLVAGAAFVIIVAGMKEAASVLTPMLLALIIAVSCMPLIHWMQSKGLSASLAFLITVLILIVIGLLLILLMGVSVGQLARALPEYNENLQRQKAALETGLAGLGVDISDVSSLDAFQPHKMIQLIGGFLASVAQAVVWAGLMLAILFFMLLDGQKFPYKLRRGLGTQSPLLTRINDYTGNIRQYVLITTWINFVVAAIEVVFLMVLGVPFPILWGILSFLLAYIPSIGFWLALIPPFLLALMASGIQAALIVLIGYVLINGTVYNILRPKLMGKGLDISPLAVFVSLFFWGWVLGAMGALLAIPLTVMIKQVFLEGYDDTRWLSHVISSGLADAGEPSVDGAAPEATT